MSFVARALVLLVVALHLGFMALEMFFWDHETGRRVFAMTPEFSAASKVLAANQGLYNGLLAAGLGFALWRGNREMLLFLLASVVVAGVFGAATAKTSILFMQALPGLLAFGAVWMTRRAG
jgi:putative membrane protein